MVQNYNIKTRQLDMVYIVYKRVCAYQFEYYTPFASLAGLETTQSVAQIGQGDDNSTTA